MSVFFSVLISFLNFLLLCAPTILLLANIFPNYLIVFASLCPLRCLNIHFGELIVNNSFFVRHYSTFLVTFFVLQRTLLIYIIVLFATFSFFFFKLFYSGEQTVHISSLCSPLINYSQPFNHFSANKNAYPF